MRSLPRSLAAGMLGLVLLACSSEEGAQNRIPPQYWGDVQVRLETRPEPVRPGGMNEFLVIATQKRGLPAYDMVVSLRTSGGEVWRQAIEDGESGVYRRALPVRPTDRVLEVQLRKARGTAQTVLRFPLTFE